MKPLSRYLCAASLIAFGAAMAFAQADPSGHWEGTVDMPNNPQKLALDLAKNDKGAWTASLGVPDKNYSGLRVADLTVEGNKVKFTAPDVPNNPVFELIFADGKLAGTLSAQGGSLPLEMKRTGDAKVDAGAAPSPAVSKELEGDWESAVPAPDGQTRTIVVHLKNQPDQTVNGTLDGVAKNATQLVLGGIKQTGDAVEFRVHIFGAAFKGTLNKERTELSGEFVVPGQSPIAMTFKKK